MKSRGQHWTSDGGWKILLFSLFWVLGAGLAFAQSSSYTIKQITKDPFDHHWPSINNNGDIVWSQQVNGLWQVFKLPAHATAASPIPVPDPNHNFQYPDIDDAGDVVYQKTGVGQGVGLQVILNRGGTESIIQLSSTNILSGQQREAGQHFGISGNGTIISYYDFCDITGSCVRRLFVSTVGQLSGDFSGEDFFDINNQSQYAFLDTTSGEVIVSPVGNSPGSTLVDTGTMPRIADGKNPEVVYIQGGQVLEKGLLDQTPGQSVDAGVWADVNDSGQIVYEKVVNGFSQIFLATPVGGLVDPAPTTATCPAPCLLNGPAIWNPTDTLSNGNSAADLLATSGTVVQGVAADGVTEVLIRIPAQNAGDQFTLTLDNDQGAESSSPDEDGALGNPSDASFTQRSLSVTAVSTTNNGPLAFAVYRAPVDFVRPTSGTGSCNGKTGTDDKLACRTVSLQIQGPSGATTTTITIVRSPVILIHGIWDDSGTWDCFSPLFTVVVTGIPPQCVPTSTDARLFVGRADYSYQVGNLVTSVSPPFDVGVLSVAAGRPFHEVISANSLGFAYNAKVVAGQIENQIQWFKSGNNPVGIPVAAVQADIVAHSMGGDITRTIAADSAFLSGSTFGQGDIHKLITIDTPHLGTPLPIDVLLPVNDCVRNMLAFAGDFAFQSARVNRSSVTGAAGDLEGDGSGGSLSLALQHLSSTSQHLLPTALIAGVIDSSNLAGLNGALLHQICGTGIPGLWPALNDPLALALTPTGWPAVFGQPSDAIVPLSSQLNNTSPTRAQEFFGFVHSGGTEKLGFAGPAMLASPVDWLTFTQSQLQKVGTEVINLLNTPVTNQSVFVPLQP